MLELRQAWAYGVNGRYLAAIVIVLLFASAFAVLVPTARAEQNAPVEISPGIWETAGDWIIEPGDFVSHGNKTINVNGNLTIQGQGTLVLYNVTLTINNTLPGQYHIEVMSGGTFLVYDGGDGLTPDDIGDSDPSWIQAPNPGVPFLFWIRPDGRFLLNRSRVGACGLPVPADPTYGDDLGVYSESDLTVIEESWLVQNSVGFIANHSKATIRRSLIAMQTYGIVAAESAVLEIIDLDLIWSQTHGIFVNGSRMFLNDSYIWRNGIVIGGEGIYATMNSALFIDNTTIEMNAWNGAVANDSLMSVTDSDVISNGRVGLHWMSGPGVDTNPIALDNYVDNHATGLLVSSQASASVEFLRNNITGCMGAAEIYAANILGNVIDNNISDAVMGIYVDGLNVSLNISRNTLDTIMDTGILVLPMLSVTADISENTINNTYGMGGRAIYVEPQGPSDLYFALNIITNVSGVGIGVFSPSDGDIVASAYLNNVTNTSTMCGFPACGGIGFYSQMGEVDVRAIGNVVNWSGDGGILVLSDMGNVTADIRLNVIANTGFLPMMIPVSIGVAANMGGSVQADVMNNTVVNDTTFWGIAAYGDSGLYGNVSGNLLLGISDLATYVAAGTGDVNLNFSDNVGAGMTGVLWATSGTGNGDITLTGNWFTNFMGGYLLDFFGGNITFFAQGNTMRTGDWSHLWIGTDGWLEAYLGQNMFGTTLSGNCVEISVWGHANITADGNSIFSAALDGFKLEAESANIFLDQNVFFANRVNFNVSTIDTSGHLYLESLNDAFRSSSASYSLSVYAAGTSNLSFLGTSFNWNSGPANLFLNQSSDISFRYVWSSNNMGAPSFWINHLGSQLNLYSYASSFDSNEIGVIIDSSGDITAQILSSNFDRNQMGSGLEMYTAFGANISLAVDDSSFSSNGEWGLIVDPDGRLEYTGTANVFTANQLTGLSAVPNRGGNLSMIGTVVAGNCMSGMGCFGMEIGSNGPRLNAVLNDLMIIGNSIAGMIVFNTDMTATNLNIRGQEFGLYSFFTNATIESSTIIQNTQGVYLDFESHFTVLNSSLESVSWDDFILDQNSSLWGINTTFNEWSMILDVLSWMKKSWFYDILVRSDTLVPLSGAFVDGYDALGGYVVNGTTDMEGYLRLNIADEVYRELGTTTYYNPHMLNATLPSVGSGSVNDSIFFYKVVIIELSDVDAPFADAGPDQIVPEDTVVQFDGTNSSDNVAIFSHTWTFLDQGIPVTLSGPTPTYTFAEPGVYIVTLDVSDNTNPPASDTVQITVLDVTPPVADAGSDQNVASGTLVTFDGSGSTDNVGVVNYTWTFTYDGSPVTLYDVSPAFLFVTLSEYEVTLTVADNATLSDTDTMTVTVTDQDPPAANAGPNQIVNEDTIVTFDGSGSSDNIGITSYRWMFLEGTNLIILEGVSPTYTFSEPGFYAVTLEVQDDAGWSDTDVMEVTVLDATPPTVVYTSPYDGATGQPLNTVVIIGFSEPMDTDSVNASTSIDSGAAIVAFNWNSPQDDTLTLTLSNLANSVTYTITIDSTATDKAGISLSAVFTTSFRTRAGIGGDTTSPTVVYSDPEDSETNVSISVLIVIVFSEPMVRTSVESAISIPGASILSYNWGPNDTLLEITIAPLSYSTFYTMTVSDAAQDLVGNPLIPYSATFTTKDPPVVDIVPPEVIYTNPEDGSSGVPISSNIIVVFSEEMNMTSVEAAISISGGIVISGFQWFSGNTSVEVLLPILSYATMYTITIADTATDIAGNPMIGPFTVNFETEAPPDAIRPYVILSSPAEGEDNVPVTTAILIVFSEAMNETSVEDAISIPGISILGYSWSFNSTMVELTLPALAHSTTYTVSISTNAMDLSDNPLYAWSISFTTTASTADTTPPEVVYTYPEDGQADVPIDDDVIIVFNEPMSRISVESALIVSGATIEGFLWNPDSTRVTVRLADLDYDTEYTLTVGSGAEDSAGNSLSPLTVVFTTMSEYGDAVAPFDILQAWWLIVIIIVLIVIIALLLLLKREPAVPGEAEPEEPIPEEPGPPPEELEAEESALSEEEDLDEPRELPDPPTD